MQKRKLTIVNRHYPPNLDITGENAWDLAKYLIDQHDIDVAIVHILRSAPGGGQKREAVGQTHPVKTIYEGRNLILRYLSSILDGYKLIKKAARLKHGPIIVMTSPPLLPMWASKILGKQKIEWILWSMDLFPEGFIASGELKQNNPLYRYALCKTYQNPPDKIIALGPMQHQALEKKYAKKIDFIYLPCGVFIHQNQTQQLPGWKKYHDKIYLGYAGNLGQPHSPAFLKTVINNINPEKHHLILVVYGVKSSSILKYAEGKKGITILPRIPREELHFLDVHLVTLLPSWTHICVPSKAVSSICSGSPMIFCGSKESDNWVLLQKAAWLIEDDDSMEEQVADTISLITKELIDEKRKQARVLTQELKQTIQQSYDVIAGWAK